MKQIIPGLWQLDEIGDTVNCFLWESDTGLTLIDTGMPSDAKTIMDAVVGQGHALHSVQRIFITHMDVDHAGSLLKLKQATGARVACHTVEKEFLEHPGRRQPANLLLRPVYAVVRRLPSFAVQPVTPDELMVDGSVTPEGFTVIHTPGHTPGHISLLHKERRVLIMGDAMQNRKNQLDTPSTLFTPDMANAQRSIWKLAKKYADDFEVVVFGHGEPILQNGGKRIKAYASQVFSTEI